MHLKKITIQRQLSIVAYREMYGYSLAGNKWFSKLDVNAVYWQIKIKSEDREKTAFVTKYGLFEFTKIGFGL